MSSPTLITPTAATATATASTSKSFLPIRSKLASASAPTTATATPTTMSSVTCRRDFLTLSATALLLLSPATSARAASDDEYVKDTSEVINKVRTTITLDRNDPNVATAVAELRETSNYWVAKYRKEKALLGRPSFRDMYSALNAVSGHYISFGPTAPIPVKRKQRILEEMDTAEKALSRGR